MSSLSDGQVFGFIFIILPLLVLLGFAGYDAARSRLSRKGK